MARVLNAGYDKYWQAAPAANTLTDLVTAGAKQGVNVTSVKVTNLDGSDRIVTIEIAPLGVAHATAHTFHQESITAGTSKDIDIGIYLKPTDVLRVKSAVGSTSVAFTATGR